MSQNTKLLLLGLGGLLILVAVGLVGFNLMFGRYQETGRSVEVMDSRTSEPEPVDQEIFEQGIVTPLGDSNRRTISGEIFTFSFDLPKSFEIAKPYGNTQPENNLLLKLRYTTPNYSDVIVSVISGTLDGQRWSPAGDWIPFYFDRASDTWIPESPKMAAGIPGPKRIRIGVHNVFLVKSADGGGNGEEVWITSPDQKYFLKLFFMRNNDSTETSLETTKTIIESFVFIVP